MNPEGTADPPDQTQARVTPGDREAAEARLQHATGLGALTLDEFAERMSALLAAQTRGELAKVVDDLPAVTAAPPARPPRPPRRWLVAVLSGTSTSGRWRPAENTTAVAFMGGVEVDLREAEVEDDELNFNAVAVMGGIDIIVPDGVEVEMTGFAFMGGRDNQVRTPPVPGAPVVRVRAFALMGGVDVHNPKPRRRAGHEHTAAPASIPMRPPGHLPGPASYQAPGSAALPARQYERRPAVSEGSRRWVRRGIIAVAIALVTSPIWTSQGGGLAVFGSSQHQVSQQAVSDGEEAVYAVPLFGSVEIVVPDGVFVEPSGLIVFGSRDCQACADNPAGSAPTVRVRGYGAFGSVEIRRAGEPAGDR